MSLKNFKIKPSEKIYCDNNYLSNAHWIVLKHSGVMLCKDKKLKAAFKKVLSLDHGVYQHGYLKPKSTEIGPQYLSAHVPKDLSKYEVATLTSEIFCDLSPYKIKGILLRSKSMACYISPDYVDLLKIGNEVLICGKGPIVIKDKNNSAVLACVMPLNQNPPDDKTLNKDLILSVLTA